MAHGTCSTCNFVIRLGCKHNLLKALSRKNWFHCMRMKHSHIFLFLLCILSACGGGRLCKPDAKREWKIGDYIVYLVRTDSLPGSESYQYQVYKGRNYISMADPMWDTDTCHVKLHQSEEECLLFDLCAKSVETLTARRTMLDKDEIDSITLRPCSATRTTIFYETVHIPNFDSTETRRLTDEQMTTFVDKWNKSSLLGFDRLDRRNYYYIIKVYTKTGVRQFKTLQRFITEDEKWSYSFRTDELFEEVWPVEK